jgi:hypothetical protein
VTTNEDLSIVKQSPVVNQLVEHLLFHTSLEVVAEEYSSGQEEHYPLENAPTPVTGNCSHIKCEQEVS